MAGATYCPIIIIILRREAKTMEVVKKPLSTSRKTMHIAISKSNITKASKRVEIKLQESEQRQIAGRVYAAQFRTKR